MNVYIRIKPPECFSQKSTFVDVDEKNMTLVQKKPNIRNEMEIKKHDFKFSKVFDIDYMNKDIYSYFEKSIISNFLGGHNCTFYLYGQTGSGKTHTLLGYENNYGFLYYLLKDLTKNIPFKRKHSCLKISAYQIYYNKMYDLFQNNLLINGYINENNEYIIHNLNQKDITKNNYSDLINDITKMRHVNISSENETSSRSHLIIEIKFGGNVLRLIDLAGSEKLKNVKKKEINENGDINKSILAWKECIRALKMKSSYIPFRGHLLTMVLKDSFLLNSYNYIFGTISPELRNTHDSLNTLTYMKDLSKITKTDKKKMEYKCTNLDKSVIFSNIINYKSKLNNITNQRDEIIKKMVVNNSSDQNKDSLIMVLNKELKLIQDLILKMNL